MASLLPFKTGRVVQVQGFAGGTSFRLTTHCLEGKPENIHHAWQILGSDFTPQTSRESRGSHIILFTCSESKLIVERRSVICTCYLSNLV